MYFSFHEIPHLYRDVDVYKQMSNWISRLLTEEFESKSFHHLEFNNTDLEAVNIRVQKHERSRLTLSFVDRQSNV